MRPLVFLALRTLTRVPGRTLLVVLGLSVTGALLLDMTMLAGGLQASLGAVMNRLGFAVRVVPRGTMPFSSDAEIADGDRLAAEIAARPGVAAAVAVLGANLYVRGEGRQFPSFALGVPIGARGVYTVLRGADLTRTAGRTTLPDGGDGVVPIVINQNMARLDGVRVGTRVVLSGAPGTILQQFASVQAGRVVGIADFYFDLPTQRSLAVAAPVLRRLLGRPGGGDSLILVRMTDPTGADALARWIAGHDPQVTAFSIQEFLERTGARLTYFNQFSLILGTVSASVAFLLIAAIVTLSVGERLGEFAMLRALGFTRARVAVLVLAEGVTIAFAALPGAFGLGILIAGNLDRILLSAPGVPEGLHFFTLTTAAVVRTVGVLLATGALGGVYPAAIVARLEIASTLHREIVS
ncbi:MAG TPA: FtsX-like permease family protein [bacterium]|nr:FtsX-like permease family protein [bacterium]